MTVDAPVVVAGAGPTGVAVATLLGQHGVPSIVIERHHDVYPLPRAVHVDDEVFRILQQLGVGEAFRTVSRPGLGLRLVDRRHRVLAQFDRVSLDEHLFPQANMFDLPDLERLMRHNLDSCPRVTLLSGVELASVHQDADRVVVTVIDEDGHTREITSQFLLGCDGATSVVRHAMGSSPVQLGFEQRWLVLDIRCPVEFDDWDGVHQVCDPHRAGTFMRVGRDRYRWEFQLLDGEVLDDFRDPAAMRELIDPWASCVDEADLEVIRCVEYTFRAEVTDRWRWNRIMVLGDAAHLTPPFTGQGMGAGLRDAMNLAWKVAAVVHGADEALLDTYELERKPHVTGLVKTAKMVGVAMTGGGCVADALRHLVLPRARFVPGLGGAVANSATPALRPGPLVTRKSAGKLRGSLLPVCELSTDEGMTIIDAQLGAGWGLVLNRTIRQDDRELANSLDAGLVSIDRASSGRGCAELHRLFDHHKVEAVLIRPDRVVLAAGRTAQDIRQRIPALVSRTL
jgi:3-(3-hydroxy-phenyl)propionate hydroxylase